MERRHYRRQMLANREHVLESLAELERAPAAAATPVPSVLLASPGTLYALASPDLQRELILLLTDERALDRGEPTVTPKAPPLENESDESWYIAIAMKAWSVPANSGTASAVA
jgi:hypothetical protein